MNLFQLLPLGLCVLMIFYIGYFSWNHRRRERLIKDVVWKRKPWTPEIPKILNKRSSYEQLYLDESRRRRFLLYCIYGPNYPPKRKKKYIDVFGIESTETEST